MFLIPHLLCLLLGLLAPDTVHTASSAAVQLQNEILALDNVHTDVLADVKLQNENVHTASSAEVQLQNETLVLGNVKLQNENVHTAACAEVLQRGFCPMNWFSFNGRCYKYVGTHFNWADAEWNCMSQGANLVSIYSVEEHNFVRALIKNFDRYERRTWIGLTDHDQAGRWTWSDGCKADFALWNKGEPNNHNGNEHCVETNYNGIQWNDVPCSLTSPSVCASRTVCP